MALTKQDRADIAAIVAETLAQFAPAPVGAPAQPVAASPVHIGPSGKPDGRIYPCTADKPCGRMLRSPGRAAVHAEGAALKDGGHTAAA